MGGDIGNELPWASVFDSAANMRALTAIQAEGFRAASRIVDRFIVAAADSVHTRAGTDTSRSRLSPDERADLWGATDIEPLLKSWWSMVNQLGRGFVPPPAPEPAGGRRGRAGFAVPPEGPPARGEVQGAPGEAEALGLCLARALKGGGAVG